jgi:N-methylhydantoinase B
MVVLTPGGGGIGAPGQRDRAQIARDVADGLISPEAAREVYGYVPPAAAE